MKRPVSKILKIGGLTIGSLIILLIIAIIIVTQFILTPTKLTPLLQKTANELLHAHVKVDQAELTFFSTFPQFGLKITNGNIISKTFRDTLFTQKDSLLSFQECLITVSPIAYLTRNEIKINALSLKNASIYAYTDSTGIANWDIVLSDSTSTEEDSTASAFTSDINIEKFILKNINLIFNDRSTDIYSRIENANATLKASLTKNAALLDLSFDNKNILFWQQGELLANHISTDLKTCIDVNRDTHTWTLRETTLHVNDIAFDINGTLVRDTATQLIDTDLKYSLKIPSVEQVLAMIPKSVIKDTKFNANGNVSLMGEIKGLYGDKHIPQIRVQIKIDDASGQYEGLPYGIDLLTAEFDAFIDLMRNSPSYANLKIFRFEGAKTSIVADGNIEDLLSDPKITFNTKSDIDFEALSKAFPLQEGIIIKGKVDADLSIKCRLSSLKKQDFGRINLYGKLNLNQVELKDTTNNFNFIADAALEFTGKNKLTANANIRNIIINSRFGNATVERLILQAKSSNPQDTTRIVDLNFTLTTDKILAMQGDSVSLSSKKMEISGTLRPSKKDITKPYVKLALKSDSLFAKANGSTIAMDLAGFDIKTVKIQDSVWYTSGIIGFNRLKLTTPDFGLPIHMRETKVTLKRRTITLHQARMRIGRSNLVASGWVNNLGRALMKGEMLKGNLSVNSSFINCNQLIKAFSGKEGDEDAEVEEQNDTTDFMHLFVIPQNLDIEFHTNIKKVKINKVDINDINGTVYIKNQSINMENLSMKAMDAEMKMTMLYKAEKPDSGYTGFDFKINDINIGNLVTFIPELDSIVPMLRSFKGIVNFDIAAETQLDSLMNIKLPTLKAAMYIKGDSLVLLDGDTFARLSKILMFKNKKENVFDSISVNITAENGAITVYPFLVEIDRYRAALGGKQNLDMSFNYHVSILKSPLPFKAGVDIYGNLDKVKFRITKAKYKDEVTPTNIQKLDTTRINMGNVIIDHIKQLIE